MVVRLPLTIRRIPEKINPHTRAAAASAIAETLAGSGAMGYTHVLKGRVNKLWIEQSFFLK
jgi:hypothetical protein